MRKEGEDESVWESGGTRGEESGSEREEWERVRDEGSRVDDEGRYRENERRRDDDKGRDREGDLEKRKNRIKIPPFYNPEGRPLNQLRDSYKGKYEIRPQQNSNGDGASHNQSSKREISCVTWNVRKAMRNRLPELQTALEKINLTEQPPLVALQETGCSEIDLKGKLNMQGMQYAAYSMDCMPSANAGAVI